MYNWCYLGINADVICVVFETAYCVKALWIHLFQFLFACDWGLLLYWNHPVNVHGSSFCGVRFSGLFRVLGLFDIEGHFLGCRLAVFFVCLTVDFHHLQCHTCVQPNQSGTTAVSDIENTGEFFIMVCAWYNNLTQLFDC